MSHESSRKSTSRSHHRTPNLYRWADTLTEVLLYFCVLWGPWAFGTVRDWSIRTMNVACGIIGVLLITKWMVRWTTGFQPARWTDSEDDSSPMKRSWRTKSAAVLTVYLLGYILVSVLNARSDFNTEFFFFEYAESFIQWLPHSYDKSATTRSFWNFLALACCFWGVRDWLLGKTRSERMASKKAKDEDPYLDDEENTPAVTRIPTRLNRLLWLLCISGGLLALIGIIQRLDGTTKLLWIQERKAEFALSVQSFGPFGYRGNGASYLNMILPICVCFLIWKNQLARYTRMVTGRKGSEAHYILFPAVCVLMAAPFISLSRGGFLVLGCMVALVFLYAMVKPRLLTPKHQLGLLAMLLTGGLLSYLIGWEPLMTRLHSQAAWYETQIEEASSGEVVTFQCDLPQAPYFRTYLLFMITDSRNSNFRSAYFNAKLEKNGHLLVELNDLSSRSQVSTLFTNLTEQLSSGRLNLEVTRNKDGLRVVANEVPLEGIQKSTGETPPSWDHPVVPNEIMVQRKGKIKDGGHMVESHFLSIVPENATGEESSIQINMDEFWSLSQLTSKMSSRDRIYEDCWQMAKEHKWLGCGAGAWYSVYLLYRDADEQWDAWVHSDPLEYWINFGAMGTLPGLALLGLVVLPSRKHRGIPLPGWFMLGLNLAIAGCLIHSFFDFPLQVVSILHLFVILCVIKLISYQPSEPPAD